MTHAVGAADTPRDQTETERPSRPPLALLANDQEWSARSLESILGPNGYAVLRAYTGRQALEMARSSLPDVVMSTRACPTSMGSMCAARSERILDSARRRRS